MKKFWNLLVIRSTHTRIVTPELTNSYIIFYKLKQAFGPAFLLTTEKRTMNIKELETFEKFHLCDYEYCEEMNCLEEDEQVLLETFRKLKEAAEC